MVRAEAKEERASEDRWLGINKNEWKGWIYPGGMIVTSKGDERGGTSNEDEELKKWLLQYFKKSWILRGQYVFQGAHLAYLRSRF